jgi:hypothetical protein
MNPIPGYAPNLQDFADGNLLIDSTTILSQFVAAAGNASDAEPILQVGGNGYFGGGGNQSIVIGNPYGNLQGGLFVWDESGNPAVSFDYGGTSFGSRALFYNYVGNCNFMLADDGTVYIGNNPGTPAGNVFGVNQANSIVFVQSGGLVVGGNTSDGVHALQIIGAASLDSGAITTNGAGKITLSSLSNYANNAAAVTAGLTAGQLYRNGDNLCIVH